MSIPAKDNSQLLGVHWYIVGFKANTHWLKARKLLFRLHGVLNKSVNLPQMQCWNNKRATVCTLRRCAFEICEMPS